MHHNTSFIIIVYWVTMFIHQFNHKLIKVIPSKSKMWNRVRKNIFVIYRHSLTNITINGNDNPCFVSISLKQSIQNQQMIQTWFISSSLFLVSMNINWNQDVLQQQHTIQWWMCDSKLSPFNPIPICHNSKWTLSIHHKQILITFICW